MAVRLILSKKNNIFTQSFIEICEHCGEKIDDIHLSEIIVKPKHDNRTLKIKDADNADYILKDKKERIREEEVKARKKQLLDESGEELKYGLRSEAMCSMSIDTEQGFTASFCYRTTSKKFLNKVNPRDATKTLSASFWADSEAKNNYTGSKVGVDRKGNIIRMKAQKLVNPKTGLILKDDSDRELEIKYKDGWTQEWFRRLSSDTQKYYIELTQNCEAFIERYGDADVKSTKVFQRFRSEAELRDAISDSRCG
jgi:hypothetical protein